MPNYIILLPPSEGKEVGGEEFFNDVKNNLSFNELQNFREELYNEIRNKILDLDEVQLEKLFDNKIDKCILRKEQLLNLDNEKTMSAINRYSGVMFKAIDYETMNENQKKNFNLNVLFIDGLFGLVKPNDLIPDYKLKINAKISDLDISKFWEAKLENVFKEIFKDKIIIDILPQVHRKVIDFSTAKEHYSIIFGEIKNNKFKQAGHLSKELKGELIRHIVSYDNLSKDEIIKFEHSKGYEYNYDLSKETQLIFLKK